ncbi:hypothetical protein KAR91_03690 [Candidatus Pacearchaeota archaeon]|nr:hypothetical protein [Candidatus Pacearchaeota archaeon]
MGKPNYLEFENRNKLFLSLNPNPIPGTFYIVQKGAFIDTISLRAYGIDRSADIVDANSELLKGRNIAAGLPQIYPDDKLWLPPEEPVESEEPETIDAKSRDEVAIRINGKIFRGWTANSIQRAINTVADSFSFQAPFIPSDPDSVYLDPYTYLDTDLFLGGKLYIAGQSNNWNPNFAVESTITTIQVRSLPGVIVDCPSTDRSLNYTGQTLKAIAEKILKPFGIRADFPLGDSGIFNKTKRQLQEKIYTFIQGLARKAGFIVNSTRDGGIKFDRANIDGIPIMSLVQGQQPLTGISGNYNGTERFSDYIAVSQSRGNVTNRSQAVDESIPVKRPIIFSAKDTSQGNISDAAKWQRSRALAKSAKVTATVGRWRDDNDNHIKENEIITLLAPNIHIYNETRFLIESVSLSKTADSINQAALNLVLPQAYTLEFPKVFPWQR